jgi:hypothetical protein
VKPKWCKVCYGRGVMRVRVGGTTRLGAYVRCVCGRLPDSRGQKLMADQEALQKRLEEVKRGTW